MNELEKAIELRNEGKLKESNELLLELAEKYPENSTVNYQCAWSFDVLGLERDAMPYYEKAISIGLDETDLKGAYLGLGSTCRTIGEYIKSRDVLMEGMRAFPEDNSIKVFYAMALYNLSEHAEAMEILLTALADTSSDENIKKYTKAIKFYAGDLDKVW